MFKNNESTVKFVIEVEKLLEELMRKDMPNGLTPKQMTHILTYTVMTIQAAVGSTISLAELFNEVKVPEI